jgi:hypothetical protein
VSLSAGMLIRDHGPGAYVAAKRSARQARAEENDKAVRFWQAVAREVTARTKDNIGKREHSEAQL